MLRAALHGDGHRGRAPARHGARRRGRRRTRAGRGRVRAPRADHVALSDGLRAVTAQPRGTARLVPAPTWRAWSSSRSTPANATGGLFDPTIHDAVVAAGYDRSFDDLVADGSAQSPPPPVRRGRRRRGASDRARRRSTRLDLGGIGKGYAVDRVCELLALVGPLSRQRRWRSRRARRLVADRRHRQGDARARAGRHRHIGDRPPTLAPERTGAASPDRPGDGSTRREASRSRHRRRRLSRRGRGSRQSSVSRAPTSAFPASWCSPTARTVLAGGLA